MAVRCLLNAEQKCLVPTPRSSLLYAPGGKNHQNLTGKASAFRRNRQLLAQNLGPAVVADKGRELRTLILFPFLGKKTPTFGNNFHTLSRHEFMDRIEGMYKNRDIEQYFFR